jgi:signal transduction histidine kinase
MTSQMHPRRSAVTSTTVTLRHGDTHEFEKKGASMAMDRRHPSQDDIQTAIRERNLVLAAVVHDLASPLSAILCAVEVLERAQARTQPMSPERLEQALRILAGAARRMAVQTQEILDTARLHAGEPLRLRPERTDLVAIVAQVAADHQARSPRHAVQLELECSQLEAFWDAARLRRVLDNLVENALKYTPDGGTVTVTVSTERAHQRKVRRGDFAVVTVRDTGIGIPAADLPYVFEPYRRAGNVRTIEGTGIGLASARQIVEQHGGSIEVESQEGKGSTLTVRLPLQRTVHTQVCEGQRMDVTLGPSDPHALV